MKLSMAHEPIILPRVIVVLLVAALAAIGVEAAEGDILGQSWSLAEVLTAVFAAGVAYIGDGLQRRAFTDSPATTERLRVETAAEIDAIGR